MMIRPTIEDQSSDINGQTLYQIVQLFGVPTFVKEAGAHDRCAPENTPQHLFADPIRRRFPCHTAAATWLSAAYYYYANQPDERIERNILKAAKWFKIENRVQDIKEKIAQSRIVNDDDLPDSAFALVYQDHEGKKVRRYPLRNAIETKTAAEYLVQYRDQFPFRDRHQMATKILAASEKYNTSVQPYRRELEKMAGIGTCSSKDIKAALACWSKILNTKPEYANISKELTKCAKLIEKQPFIREYSQRLKIAELLDSCARLPGVPKPHGMERPEDVVFGLSDDEIIRATDEIVENPFTGMLYEKTAIATIPLSDIADVFGEEFASRISTANAWPDPAKLNRELRKMSRREAERFDSLAIAAGVSPFAKYTD